MKTAYAYARFSSDSQREESITAQLRAIREYCAHNDIKILQEYKDEAFSARTDKRPAFQELFARVKERPADYLIVHKLDRFARNRYDAALYRAKLKENDMKLISVLEPMDDTPESIIVEGLLESLNEYYSANLSRETKKGFKENILKGKRCGARTPKGYDCVNQHLVKNADAPIVKKLFDMYADGASYSQMVQETGIKGPTICAMLRNENYRGALVHGENRYEHAHEAIVDEETWARCQKRINDRQMNAANRAKHDYMLSGLLYCAKCGRRMWSCSSGDGHLYYRCWCKSRRKEEVEKKVVDVFSKYMAPTADIKAKFYALVSERVNNNARADEVIQANLGLQKRIDKILNAIQFADDDQAEFLLNQAKELKAKMVPVPKKVSVPKEVTDAYIDRLSNFKNLQPDEQKKILRNLVSKIEYDGKDVRIILPNTLGAVDIA